MMDWEHSGPSPEVLAAFSRIDSEDEFPRTYSGSAWRAAYRLWQLIKDAPEKLEHMDGYGPDNWQVDDLHLTGFMAGWAVNAVRQMFKMSALPSPAIVTFGGPERPHYVLGSCEQELRLIFGEGALKQ